MKSFKITFFCLLFFAIGANAQYGYNNAGPGVIRNNGMPNTQQTPKEPTPEEIEKIRTEKIDSYMSKLKTDLTLDELQYIAIKNELTASSKRMDIVVKRDNYTDAEKTTEINSIQEKMEKTILSYLNASQKEKYELLKTQKPDKKEDKKKKKAKGKDEKNEVKEKEIESETKN